MDLGLHFWIHSVGVKVAPPRGSIEGNATIEIAHISPLGRALQWGHPWQMAWRDPLSIVEHYKIA